MSDTTAAHKEQLAADLKRVLADAEALLRATAGDSAEELQHVRGRLQATLSHAKDGLIEAQAAVVDKARQRPRRPMAMCTRTPGRPSAWQRAWACCWAW